MTTATTVETASHWTEEPSTRPGRKKIRARISGMHCSLCTGTIEKALGRMPGVDRVAVSLTHEQALVEYDPMLAQPEELIATLRDIGYYVSDPRKLRAFEEEERDLVREGRRFVAAVVLSVASIALIANPTEHWWSALPALVCLSLGALVFLVLRPSGLGKAMAGFSGLVVMALTLLVLNLRGVLTVIAPWAVGSLAVILVFGIAHHILRMAVQALRRGILNQHVLLEVGAFAGLVGGMIGLVWQSPMYPTGKFFAVSVMVGVLSGGDGQQVGPRTAKDTSRLPPGTTPGYSAGVGRGRAFQSGALASATASSEPTRALFSSSARFASTLSPPVASPIARSRNGVTA